jgi:catechol-2,3-dioxygenase
MKIKHLKLDCANLEEQKYFYTKKFDFELANESEGEITLKVGSSLLTFSENRLKKSYYHFAFNIPLGAMDMAVAWVKKRVEVLPTDHGDIQEFPNWEARSIYFLDPAGNVVELIGRKNFDESKPAKFGKSQLLNISEVGLPVFQVTAAATYVEKTAGVRQFGTSTSTFCAQGNDEGLFIIVDKAEKTWFPTDEVAKEYPLGVSFESDKGHFHLQLEGGGMTIEPEKKLN